MLTVLAVCGHSLFAASEVEHVLELISESQLPRERVYLHLDNTSYHYGDNIWFKAYLVNADGNSTPPLSNTLYVELLTPGGLVLQTKALKVTDGQANSEFAIDFLPFYSGFYEIRAYTKYMLNYGDVAIFSRVIPIFDKPANEADRKWRGMQKYGQGLYKYVRKKPHKGKPLSMKFYPEGGNLVYGLRSRVAFEAIDASGHTVDVSGRLTNSKGEFVDSFVVDHNGKGMFDITPGKETIYAEAEYDGKIHRFKLPNVLDKGYVLTVDNITNPDSIDIEITRGGIMGCDTLGLAIFGNGALKSYAVVTASFLQPVKMKFDKCCLAPGVADVVLLDSRGLIIASRKIFRRPDGVGLMTYAFDKPQYGPYEPIELTLNMNIDEVAPFSLSVRDNEGEIAWHRDIRTDLLLMSEIKGYVADPAYYFESEDYSHRRHLDQLLMVQGWERYPFGVSPEADNPALRYKAETKGIETVGIVYNLSKEKGEPGVDISALLVKNDLDNQHAETISGMLRTDSLGHFSFTTDAYGDCYMVLSASKNGKKKDYSIAIDRLFSPKPSPYRFTDLEISEVPATKNVVADTVIPESIPRDTLTPCITGDTKPIHLKEILVKDKKHTKAHDIYADKSNSYAYYDMKSELDDIRDEGGYVGRDIHEFLIRQNNEFYRVPPDYEYLFYKGRLPLFVINYEPTEFTERGYFEYKLLRMEAVKSIYVSEKLSTLQAYADPRIPPSKLNDIFGCTVLIETYPDGHEPADAGKGVRKTRLHGYSIPTQFYSPDYSLMEPEADYRRTLYWNPSVVPDKDGRATVKFYNNSICKTFTVDAQTVTPSGKIAITSR